MLWLSRIAIVDCQGVLLCVPQGFMPFLATVSVPVAIPAEVEEECCGSKKALDAVIIQRALNESRIKTVVVKNRRLVGKLQADFSLGRGEAEAIALALVEKAEVLGIDDKNGINACKLLGVAFTTAVGILIRSRQGGHGPGGMSALAGARPSCRQGISAVRSVLHPRLFAL